MNDRSLPELLLHVCCAACGVAVARELGAEFRVSLYYHNPNVYPPQELDRRGRETARIAAGLCLYADPGRHEEWLRAVAGLEGEPERGERCLVCYRYRLTATAAKARSLGIGYFTTTLTTSPHKDASAIARIGREVAAEFGLSYVDRDFKKRGGGQRSAALARELGLYRQDYCGCEFSFRPRKNIENKDI